MRKFDSLTELRAHIENWLLPNVNNITILINNEENYLSAVYDGRRMCKIYRSGELAIRLEFEEGFYNDEEFVPQKRWCYIENLNSFVLHISNSIMYYKKKGQKNMTNSRQYIRRHFIVEKMEVQQRCSEPDVINMIVRKEPDGIPFQTGRDLKTLIESIDPDKLSSDSRIAADIGGKNVEKQIYMITARGSGKTRWISEMFKNSFSFKDHIKDVIFNDPATIVLWNDGSKTVVKCQKGETFDPEKGLAMAISKKVLGNGYDYYEVFNKYVGRYNKKRFNKALEEAKKIPPDEITYNGGTYVLKNKEAKDE